MSMHFCRIHVVWFLLLLPIIAGCQSALKTSSGESLSIVYDDLYQSRLADPFSAALYHFSIARLIGMEGDLNGAAVALEKAVAADPDSAYLKIALAEVYLHLDEGEKAFRSVEDALIKEPELLQGHLLMVNLLSARGNYRLAITHLEKAAEINPENERIMMQQALFYSRINEMGKSIAVLKSLIEQSPENIYALLTLARAYQQTDLLLLAEQTYEAILEINPESYLSISELGKLYAESNRIADAEALYLRKLQQFPDNYRLRHQLAGQYIDQERFEDALIQLQIILDSDPDNLTALRKAGLLYLQKEDWQAATDYFSRLVQGDSVDSQARYYLGLAQEGIKQWPEALISFGLVSSDSSVYADALIHRGYILHELNRTEDAIALLEGNRNLLSDRPEIYDYLSFLYNKLDRHGEALAVIDAGLQQYPEDNTLLFRKIVLLEQGGETDQADNTAIQLLDINPDHVNALNYLAYSYAVRNINLEQALQLAQKALTAKDALYIRDTLGWVFYRLGRFEEALGQLQQAAEGLQNDPVVLEHLGDVLQALGRSKEALSAFQRAVPEGGVGNAELMRKIETLGNGN